MSSSKIKTPHAAVLVWNYIDRIGVPSGEYDESGVKNLLGIEKDNPDAPPVIVSTLSCVSIQTQKTKAQPEGSFNLVLAPYKNWVSTLTAGSWCVIMMSNEPIKEEDLKSANKNHVKMLGRIESVRCETNVDDDGTRRTLYYVSGTDWGHIFSSILYIDNLIASPKDPKAQGNGAAVAIQKALFGNDGAIKSFPVRQNLVNLLDVMGKSLGGYTEQGKLIGRLANSIYEFKIPDGVANFFDFRDASGNEVSAKSINKLLSLITGSLVGKDHYDDKEEAVGFLDPFSLQGTHSLWQILLENSNPTMNEMLCEMKWSEEDDGLQLALYNRIKPFSYKNFTPAAGQKTKLKSYFQLLKTHLIDANDVISVNAGTNWRDKFNFVEIKPNFQEFAVIENWTKQKAQAFDEESFEREGFRPLIFDTKQFPSGGNGSRTSDVGVNWNMIIEWVKLMREWYFGTHRTLNGTITIHGSTEYIAVGNNIKFDAGLLNPTPNINFATKKKGKNKFILGHIENVAHSFSVSQDGARTYRTTIQFVRGIVVDENNINVGDGLLDQDATKLSQSDDRNTRNINSTSTKQDPDPQKVRGR